MYLFSNYVVVQNRCTMKHISGPMHAHALNGGPHVTITFSHGEGFKASLLFSLA